MPGNIWIDGTNGIGKTVAARTLENSGFKYKHNGRPLFYNKHWIMFKYKLFELTHTGYVIDRSFPSEWVHGNVERGSSAISIKQCKNLTKFIRNHGSVIFLFVPKNYEETANTIANRNEAHPLTPDQTLLEIIGSAYLMYSMLTDTEITKVKYVSNYITTILCRLNDAMKTYYSRRKL